VTVFSREERQYLNTLSKEVTGVSSKWQKMAKGIPELVTKTIKETVPAEEGKEPTVKEMTVAALTPEGAKQYRTKFYTYEEIKNLLLNIKKQRDEYAAKQKEVQRQAELVKQVQEQAAGLV
jgi:hypothetical protein